MKYLKRLDLVIGLDFHSNFVVTLVTNFTLDQQKRESFDDPEFLNKSFQLALSKKKKLFTTNFTATVFSVPKLYHCFK